MSHPAILVRLCATVALDVGALIVGLVGYLAGSTYAVMPLMVIMIVVAWVIKPHPDDVDAMLDAIRHDVERR